MGAPPPEPGSAVSGVLRQNRGLLLALGVALLARLVVAGLSIGTNDILTWERFGRLIASEGLAQAYAADRLLNHPPLVAFFAEAAVWLADATGLRFSWIFKAPVILADVAVVGLLWGRQRVALGLLLLFALNPAGVLVSAYHGNTDSLCVALCVWSVLLLERGSAGLAGLLLGAAINVKLIPVLLIAPLLLTLPAAAALRFTAGLAVGALPFLPLLANESFVRNVVGYQPWQRGWGLAFLVLQSSSEALLAAWRVYGALARYLIVGVAVVVGLWARRLPRPDPVAIAALTFSIFLVLAPGFGVQYVVYPLPFLFAVRPRLGLEVAWLAGLFVGGRYLVYWDGRIPATSIFTGRKGAGPNLVGLLAWYLLLRFSIEELWSLLTAVRRREAVP